MRDAAERADGLATEISASGGDEVGQLLGDAEVEVSIEIARRALTILELIELRDGDVLEFRAPVSARVAVVAAGVVVAHGELVDVEGALGVRITKVGGGHGD